MQKITITFPIPSTTGAHEHTLTAQVDETIGLNAGRDIYATARGTAKAITRKYNPFKWAWVRLDVNDGEYVHEYRIEDGKWIEAR